MYELNLTVPDITSPEYSSDNKFFLLKNYLVELNEALSYALSDKCDSETLKELIKTVENNKINTENKMLRVNAQNVKRFERLEAELLSTNAEH